MKIHNQIPVYRDFPNYTFYVTVDVYSYYEKLGYAALGKIYKLKIREGMYK